MADELVQVGFRLPADMVKRLDAHAQRLERMAPPGMAVTRTDALRALLLPALDAAEAPEKPKTKKR